MNNLIGGIFNLQDRIGMESLNQRLTRSEVITGNVANSETPGYRALGYDFEEQLQALSGEQPIAMKTSNAKHLRNAHTSADGKIYPDVFVRPSESVGQDGNTVDVDKEMGDLAQNQILYKATAELLTRKIGILKYAITAGGR